MDGPKKADVREIAAALSQKSRDTRLVALGLTLCCPRSKKRGCLTRRLTTGALGLT